MLKLQYLMAQYTLCSSSIDKWQALPYTSTYGDAQSGFKGHSIGQKGIKQSHRQIFLVWAICFVKDVFYFPIC